jgi:hypothetical protein
MRLIANTLCRRRFKIQTRLKRWLTRKARIFKKTGGDR